MLSSILEVSTIVFALITAVLDVLGLVNDDVSRNILTILSMLLPLIYSYRRRRRFREFCGLLKGWVESPENNGGSKEEKEKE